MYNYKLKIQYDGGRYKGWQRLGKGENTIQEKIEKVISELFGEAMEIIGCSRTDAGVHALEQVANFKSKEYKEPKELQRYLNEYLPQDISILEVELVPEDFHSRYHALEKTYLYKIWNKDYPNPFIRKYSMYIDKPLDMDKMIAASKHFIGEFDFTAFSNAKSKKKSKLRELYEIKIEIEEGLVLIRLRGNGFLHHMARKIVGILI